MAVGQMDPHHFQWTPLQVKACFLPHVHSSHTLTCSRALEVEPTSPAREVLQCVQRTVSPCAAMLHFTQKVGEWLCKPVIHMETIIPKPWLASLEFQKSCHLSKDYFPILFQSLLAPTHFDTKAVQNNLSLLFSFR